MPGLMAVGAGIGSLLASAARFGTTCMYLGYRFMGSASKRRLYS